MISANAWFHEGKRVLFDTASKKITSKKSNEQTVSVFERVVNTSPSNQGARWLTMLAGFPDGSFGWSKVDACIQDETTPRLYIEYVGQGDSDKPNDYNYNTMERADLVEAQWAAHGVKKTVVVTFDYSSLVLLELLQRHNERVRDGKSVSTQIEHVLLINGGYFADGHSHPISTTPLLQTWMGRMGCWMAQKFPFAFNMMIRPLFSKEYEVTLAELKEIYEAITRRGNGAMFMSNGAGFVREHKQPKNTERWNLKNVLEENDHRNASISVHVVGSEKDQFEPKQLILARERLGKRVDTSLIPGGHMATSEQAKKLAELVDKIIVAKK